MATPHTAPAAVLGIMLKERSIIDLDGTFFVQLAIFVLLFLLLRWLVFRPLMRVFDARDKAILGVREDAKAAKERAEQASVELEEKLEHVRREVAQEREKLRAEGLAFERELLEKVRNETQASLNEAEMRLVAEKERTRLALQEDLPKLAEDIASKVLGRQVSS